MSIDECNCCRQQSDRAAESDVPCGIPLVFSYVSLYSAPDQIGADVHECYVGVKEQQGSKGEEERPVSI